MLSRENLISWTEKALRIKIDVMDVPKPIKTIEQILTELNNQGAGMWIALEGYYGLPGLKIEDNGSVANGKDIIVGKVFVNTATGEIKTFVAKTLDIPEREKLWPKT